MYTRARTHVQRSALVWVASSNAAPMLVVGLLVLAAFCHTETPVCLESQGVCRGASLPPACMLPSAPLASWSWGADPTG